MKTLLEFLTDDQRADLSKNTSYNLSPKAKKDTDHYFGKGINSVHHTLDNEPLHKSEIHKKIELHLNTTIKPEDYKAGKVKEGGRKIGKLIKDKDLKNEFDSDNTIANKSSAHLHVSIHRGIDVAGQTNLESSVANPSGHSWKDESCKNIKTGMYNTKLKHESKHGTVVTYLHDHEGKEIARSLLQPHHNEEGVSAHISDSYYGVNHAGFKEHIKDLEKKLSQPHSGSFKYMLHHKVYHNNGEMYSSLVNSNPNVTSEHISKALDDKKVDVRTDAINHPNATSEHITKALNDEDSYIRKIANRRKNEASLKESIKYMLINNIKTRKPNDHI